MSQRRVYVPDADPRPRFRDTRPPAKVFRWIPVKERIKFHRERMLRENPRCFYCQSPVDRKTATVDHFTPKSKGGRNHRDNFVLSCKKCNQAKGDAQ